MVDIWWEQLKGGLIVSCQALPSEPLYGGDTMTKLALAALMGGAAGIRTSSVENVSRIKNAVDVPVIGLIKRDYLGSPVYITPTMTEVDELQQAGADVIAFDATARIRPNGRDTEAFIQEMRSAYPDLRLLADIATLEEGIRAEQWGVDAVSTTMSGYTDDSPASPEPDMQLVERLASRLSIPVVAEGRIATPEQAASCLRLGAYAVVVGSAITRPQLVTAGFVGRLRAEQGRG